MHFKITQIAVDGDARSGSIVDHGSPVFSWAAEHSEDGMRQSAYRIAVRSEAKLKWDSGWVESVLQSAVYAGEELKAGEELYWTVSIRDIHGRESAPKDGFFITGRMGQWNAEWITTPWDREGEAKYFRKVFSVENSVRKAYLYICGIGCQYITLNDMQVDAAILQPAFSNYAKQCYYVTLPVTDFLRSGENTLEVAVGEGWRRNRGDYLKYISNREIEFFGVPKLTAELILEYDNGISRNIVTDKSWQCGHGPIVCNHLFDGERYDERIQKEYSAGAVVVTEPAPQMKAQAIRPILEQEIFNPVMKTKVGNGYVFDFGTNIAGVVEIRIPGDMPAGTEVKIFHTENIAPDGSPDPETIRGAKATDVFISAGVKEHRVWRPRFTYHGFRYIYVEGWPGIPQAEDFKAIAFYTDIKNKSYFRCGSPMVNQLQECIVRTEKNNLHSIATDCPQRDERMGWLNDATVRFEEMPYNFSMNRLFSKIMDDIAAEQSEDGAITCTAPYVYGERPADPVSSSFLIAALENYLHYGNTADIAKHYAHFKAWNACLKRYSEDGIVTLTHYGDWAGPADCCESMECARSIMTPGMLMSTGYHYYNYQLLAKFARILGDTQEARKNEAEAKRVQKAFLERWFDEKTGTVALGSQGSQAFALWLGILPENKRQLAAARLHDAVVKAGYRITTGNLPTRYLLDMLAEFGYVEDAWKLITREEYPSWGFMLQNGATTVWERFEFKRGSGMNSHDHPMYGAVGAWFYSHIAGIKPGTDGWQKFSVQPYMPEKLLYAEAGVETPFGMIYVKWQKQLGCTDVFVNIPFGTEATVILPWGEKIVVGSGYHSFHGKQEEMQNENYE